MVKLRKKFYLLVFLLIVVLMMAWLYYLTINKPQVSSKKPHVQGQAEGLTVHQFDETGRLHYQGTATKAIHYTTDNTRFYQPKLKLAMKASTSEPWYAASDQAFVWSGNNHVFLSGHVQLWRHKGQHNRALTFQTSEIDLYTKTHMAETDKDVTISEPGTKNVTTATGMRGNWQQETMYLLSNVMSIYEPNTPS